MGIKADILVLKLHLYFNTKFDMIKSSVLSLGKPNRKGFKQVKPVSHRLSNNNFQPIRGVRKLAGENLKVVWAEFLTLS